MNRWKKVSGVELLVLLFLVSVGVGAASPAFEVLSGNVLMNNQSIIFDHGILLGNKTDAAADAVAVSNGANASGTESVAIGKNATASATGAIALGTNASAPNLYEATLGSLTARYNLNVTGNATFHGGNAVEILNGNLKMSQNDIVNPNRVNASTVTVANAFTAGNLSIADTTLTSTGGLDVNKWGDASELTGGGAISTFSNASDLDANGDLLGGVVTGTELAGDRFVNESGDTMTGSLSLSNANLTGVNNTAYATTPAGQRTCSAGTEGEITYNGTHHIGCDGTTWQILYR